MVFLTANFVFLATVACALAAIVTSAFLQPDPLQVVVMVLEELAANQTQQLARHLGEVHTVLQAHSAV